MKLDSFAKEIRFRKNFCVWLSLCVVPVVGIFRKVLVVALESEKTDLTAV
jgi:hypothetical protein